MENGRGRFCSPHFHNQARGGEGRYDAACEGDRGKFGGAEKGLCVSSSTRAIGAPFERPYEASLTAAGRCLVRSWCSARLTQAVKSAIAMSSVWICTPRKTTRSAPRGNALSWTWGQFVAQLLAGHFLVKSLSSSERSPICRALPSMDHNDCALSGERHLHCRFVVSTCESAPSVSHAVPSAETGVISYVVELGFVETDADRDMCTRQRLDIFSAQSVPRYHLAGNDYRNAWCRFNGFSN